MLILTRRISESIVVGDEVKVTVLGVKGNQVRLGIDAPKNIEVHREEIYERIQQEKGKTADSSEEYRGRGRDGDGQIERNISHMLFRATTPPPMRRTTRSPTPPTSRKITRMTMSSISEERFMKRKDERHGLYEEYRHRNQRVRDG